MTNAYDEAIAELKAAAEYDAREAAKRNREKRTKELAAKLFPGWNDNPELSWLALMQVIKVYQGDGE